MATTTRFSGNKAWSWSYSKLKNFEACPKRHYEVDIAKTYKDGGDALEWGSQVHAVMAKRLSVQATLPIDMIDYEKFAQRFEDKAKLINGRVMVEQKFAINRAFEATGYFAPDVWYRSIGDALAVGERVALIVDWKTGGMKDDPVQLFLMAQCVFSAYPNIQAVVTRFAWLKEHAETDETFKRADMVRLWPAVLDRLGYLERAAQTQTYPPTPNFLCKRYCPVLSCPYHGKDHRS